MIPIEEITLVLKNPSINYHGTVAVSACCGDCAQDILTIVNVRNPDVKLIRMFRMLKEVEEDTLRVYQRCHEFSEAAYRLERNKFEPACPKSYYRAIQGLEHWLKR